LNIHKDFPFLNSKSQQYKDIERFSWFSDNYLAIDPANKNRIFDIRYSMLPNQISGLWGIEIDYDSTDEQHIKYITNRSLSQRRFKDLKDMILDD
jgi:inner membrane protein